MPNYTLRRKAVQMRPNLTEIKERLKQPTLDWVRDGGKYDVAALLTYVEQLEEVLNKER